MGGLLLRARAWGVGARGPQQSTETVCEGLKALAVRMEVQVRVLGQWEEGE
jgi:hypothetical protein